MNCLEYVRKKSVRNTRAAALLELASIAWLIPIVALISLNVCLAGFAAWINDTACREVARAASREPDLDKAKLAAALALKTFKTGNQYAFSPELGMDGGDFVFETFADENGKSRIDQGPYVKVTTKMDLRLPVPVLFATDGISDHLKFKQSYTYPLLNPAAKSPLADSSYAMNTPQAPGLDNQFNE